ncbi:hypothetical protein BD626DRAFT_578732 [Schizophyllum amplum]|uniref:Uncharacterized protein n=1 Tax=Schizophyllum amplum TaxID=97359 RepID=A0A550BRV8_9AGAR|nr:hypothetical protein BD626DRAFT_578732 [Auriculariopsis ampla]
MPQPASDVQPSLYFSSFYEDDATEGDDLLSKAGRKKLPVWHDIGMKVVQQRQKGTKQVARIGGCYFCLPDMFAKRSPAPQLTICEDDLFTHVIQPSAELWKWNKPIDWQEVVSRVFALREHLTAIAKDEDMDETLLNIDCDSIENLPRMSPRSRSPPYCQLCS